MSFEMVHQLLAQYFSSMGGMSSSLEINVIFHCLISSYITCNTPIVYCLFNHLTSPCNSKVTSRDVSQWFVKNIKRTCPQLDMGTVQNLLAQNITNLMSSKVQQLKTTFWLVSDFHSQSTESLNWYSS